MPFADSNIAEFNDFGKAVRSFFTTVHVELFVRHTGSGCVVERLARVRQKNLPLPRSECASISLIPVM